MTAYQYQQEYCNAFFNRDWDRFSGAMDELKYIKEKIAYALFGKPQETELEDDADVLKGYSKKQIKLVTPLYDKIINFKKYSLDQETIFMAIIFNCCIPLQKNEELPFHAFIESDKIIICPVFKIRKCVKGINSDTSCTIYMDDHGRIYKDWKSYLTENTLPKGVMIVPKNGKYFFNISQNPESEEETVQLEAFKSPACSVSAQTKQVLNVSSTVAGLGATGVIVTALFAPVTVPILTGATVVGIVAGVCSATTSALSLKDRSQHDQAIGLTDAEARNCWINIAATSFGISAGAASKYIATSVSKGVTISQAIRGIHDTSLFGSALTGFAGISYGFHSMIKNCIENKKKPSSLEIVQLSTSIFFFTHSMVNFKMANTLIKETQISTLNTQRDMLRSNRHRKIFDKMSGETRRRLGNMEAGNTEIIKSMRNINNKDEFFANALRMNKELNSNQIKISFHEEGAALLNTNSVINPEQHMTLSTIERNLHYTSIGPSELSTKNFPTKLNSPVYTMSKEMANGIQVIPSVIKLFNDGQQFVNHINSTGEMSFEKIIFDIYDYLGRIIIGFATFSDDNKQFIIDRICSMVNIILSKLDTHYIEMLNYISPMDSKKLIYEFVSGKLVELAELGHCKFLDYLKLLFSHDGLVNGLVPHVQTWLDDEVPFASVPIKCDICGGNKYSH